MKRFLVLLSVLGVLSAATACSSDYNLSVDAWAQLIYMNGPSVRTETVHYGGFHHRTFSNSDLEMIFTDLTQGYDQNFSTAVLNMVVYDEINGELLRDEAYSVVYSNRSGHFEFADMNTDY